MKEVTQADFIKFININREEGKLLTKMVPPDTKLFIQRDKTIAQITSLDTSRIPEGEKLTRKYFIKEPELDTAKIKD